ncbi:MAG: autotransporter-associated beta strand repeat-containing protein [Planctomycetales bacterium]|nr:autotransporter-associated beta strand repeat-containing protein [Planctomycetales bacterium]
MRFLLLSCAALAAGATAQAASDVWTNGAGGDYTVSGNWQAGNVPNGVGNHADFSQLDINGDLSVTLNSDVTLGQLSFGDTNTASGGSWELRTDTVGGSTITLDNGASKPVITGNPLVPATTFDDAFIGLNLAGSNGFAKEGSGIITIGGNAHTVTGGVDVNAGTMRLRTALPDQALSIANGATLDTTVDIRYAAGINVASGDTVNIIAKANLGNMNAAGSTINLSTPAGGGTATANNNWALNGSIAALNVSGDDATTSFFRLRNNGGSFSGSSFAGTAVNLDNITVWTRTNSGGNTNQFGSLSGTATAVLSGGGEGGGSFANYQIGALNTDTEFAGTIDTTSSPTPNSTTDLGGLNLTKVGTGVLTLSGTLNYQPTGNSNSSRRAGITTIADGTLKLTNSAAIPGGIVHTTLGDIYSTLNIQAAGTLDVSGYSGTYSTAALQRVVGAGTIAGNYAHDEGVLLPGNTISGTNPNSVAAGGTLSFSNNFAWSGGEYVFDLTDDPNAGNDLISVAGMTTLSGGKITPNFISALPAGGTTFTVLTSAGGISGLASSITVDWTGRGSAPVPFVAGNDLKITLPTAGANLVWQGADATNPTYWDVETTHNWTGATPNTFFQNDSVTFDDTAASFAVDLQTDLAPNSVVIDNSANAYTITAAGGGSITGISTLVKTGSADLTMDVNNTFTGTTSLSGSGTIDIVGTNSALGKGTLELNGVTIRSSASGASITNSSIAVTGVNTIQADDVVSSSSLFNVPTLTGSGTLTLASSIGNPVSGSEQDGKWFVLNDTTGFTGTLNLTGPAATQQGLTVRISHSSTDLGGAVLNMTNATIANRDNQGSPEPNRTIEIGELHGDAESRLVGFIGGSSGRPNIDWSIGALNTNSDFAGDITDPGGGNNAVSSVVKVGTGSLALTGAKSYTGDTRVLDGTLSIDTDFLADAADVYLTSTAILDLNFGSLATIDTIDSLFINGVSQATGTWGRVGSGAMFESALFTGDGLLLVSTQETLGGDFDDNGKVNGADFLAWQRGYPATYNATDLAAWESNFGAGTLALAATGPAAAAVPEPTTLALTAAGLIALGLRTRRRRG